MTIYLQGVSHDYQEKECSEFREYLLDVWKDFGIKSMAEEMNPDWLKFIGVDCTTVEKVADLLSVPYKMCDPNNAERDRLRLEDPTLLKIKRMNKELTDDEWARLNEENYRCRERFWLERIPSIYVDPMLFVCGIEHLKDFQRLLQCNGYDCKVLDSAFSSRVVPEAIRSLFKLRVSSPLARRY